jgi:hypothetical protein
LPYLSSYCFGKFFAKKKKKNHLVLAFCFGGDYSSSMIKDGLYHKEVGFPSAARALVGRKYVLALTSHAQEACKTDRYGIIYPPRAVEIKTHNIVELEFSKGEVVKILVRAPYNARHDVLIAFVPDGDGGRVKTLWLNQKSDCHLTLDRSKYLSP